MLKKIALVLVFVLLAAAFCACAADEQQAAQSPETERTAAITQVHVTFRDKNTDTVYEAILEPGASAIMGRKDTSDIIIADEHVSRVHCKLTLFEGKVFVEDMDSTNGTFLVRDGDLVEVTESTEIKEGEILVLADVYLIVESIR